VTANANKKKQKKGYNKERKINTRRKGRKQEKGSRNTPQKGERKSNSESKGGEIKAVNCFFNKNEERKEEVAEKGKGKGKGIKLRLF
jgi:hypothetical protein